MTLIKCLRSIREYAFIASPYPVIITLEDHLTPDLQAKVAEVRFMLFMDLNFEANFSVCLVSDQELVFPLDGYSNIWGYAVLP